MLLPGFKPFTERTEVMMMRWMKMVRAAVCYGALCCALAATNAGAELRDLFDSFDYGEENQVDIPDWFDQSGAEEFYLGSGNSNVPFDADTGAIGFKYTSSTNQYLYRELGTYAGERMLSYQVKIATYLGQTQDRSGALLVRIFRNNTVVAEDDLDIAADADSLLVDSELHGFTCPASSHIATLSGILDLRSVDLDYGDRLFFQITYTNPEGRSFCMDNLVAVVDRGLIFSLVAKGSGKALGIEGAAATNGAPLIQETAEESPSLSQQWRCVPLEPGYFGILNENSGKGMDVFASSTQAGKKVVQWDPVNGFGFNQQWWFSDAGDGWQSILNRNSGLALTVRNNGLDDGAVLEQQPYSGSDGQKFRMVPLGHIKAVNRDTQKAMEVYGRSSNNGGNIDQWSFHGGPNQLWNFVHVEEGYYALLNRHSAKAVQSDGSGVNIEQRAFSGSSVQQWKLLMNDGGYFQLINRDSGQVAAIESTVESNGVNVVLNTAGDGPGRLWILSTDDIPGFTLMQKYSGNPIFEIKEDGVPQWRWSHAANVAILDPSQTPNGQWMLYCRGSASYGPSANDFHDTIGVFSQETNSFSPFGPWQEYASNPVLSYGEPGDFDERHLLGTVVMRRADGATVLYYKGKDFDGNHGLGAAVSTDGFNFVKLPDTLFPGIGPVDAVFHNDEYHLFSGEMLRISEDGKKRWILRQVLRRSDTFDDFSNSTPTVAITTGSVGSYDSKCASAGKIFQVSGDPRWFMIYQTSDVYIDYPDRFNAAFSYDLIHWIKVKNDRPLMTRGERGAWDQGGIWTGSIIEHDGSIYIFYEGWGSYSTMVDRDELYYKGANSRVGVASVSVDDFLAWVEAGTAERVEKVSMEMDASGCIQLGWSGASGSVYSVQTDNNLVQSPGWSNLVRGIPGVDGTMTVTTAVDRVQSFFRIIGE